jgi:hypothetical protein
MAVDEVIKLVEVIGRDIICDTRKIRCTANAVMCVICGKTTLSYIKDVVHQDLFICFQ